MFELDPIQGGGTEILGKFQIPGNQQLNSAWLQWELGFLGSSESWTSMQRRLLPLLTPSSQPCDPNHLSAKLSDWNPQYLNCICLVLLAKAESSIRAVRFLVCFVPVCPRNLGWEGRLLCSHPWHFQCGKTRLILRGTNYLLQSLFYCSFSM